MTEIYFPHEQNDFFKDHVIGKTVIDIKKTNDTLAFLFSDYTRMRMYHSQSCCERVDIDDITGDLDDLLNSPILGAEERESCCGQPRDPYDTSYQWTFYSFKTMKGYVDIRWYGCSNGYYSEAVDIEYYDPVVDDHWDDVFRG